MKSIAALRCGAFFAALSLRDWARAWWQARSRRCHLRCRRIPERSRVISRKKFRPRRHGRARGLILPIDIGAATGGDVGSAGGIVAVVTVNGVGGDH